MGWHRVDRVCIFCSPSGAGAGMPPAAAQPPPYGGIDPAAASGNPAAGYAPAPAQPAVYDGPPPQQGNYNAPPAANGAPGEFVDQQDCPQILSALFAVYLRVNIMLCNCCCVAGVLVSTGGLLCMECGSG